MPLCLKNHVHQRLMSRAPWNNVLPNATAEKRRTKRAKNQPKVPAPTLERRSALREPEPGAAAGGAPEGLPESRHLMEAPSRRHAAGSRAGRTMNRTRRSQRPTAEAAALARQRRSSAAAAMSSQSCSDAGPERRQGRSGNTTKKSSGAKAIERNSFSGDAGVRE